jgi:hypothetical protein
MISNYNGQAILHNVPINAGGYTRRGVYYGVGARLYYIQAEMNDGEIYESHFRAIDRENALEIARHLFPRAKFRP